MKKAKTKIIKNIEEIKKEISIAEQALLIKHNKNLRKYLKNYIDNKRKLASFINEND